MSHGPGAGHLHDGGAGPEHATGAHATGLRWVLAVAAVGAGLVLTEVAGAVAGGAVLTHDQAVERARAWGLAEAAPTVVVLVDGLGLGQLSERRGHVPRLRSWLSAAGTPQRTEEPAAGLRTCWPTTTAAALTTLGTTAPPGTTGMVGYSVLNPFLGPHLPRGTQPSADHLVSLISWQASTPRGAPDPRAWQDVPTVFERLRRHPGRGTARQGQSPGAGGAAQPPTRTPPAAVSVGPARFAGSGLTEAALRGTHHLAADRLEDRAGLAARALRAGTPLVYLYVGELDSTGHRYGWRSQRWLEQLERLDAAVSELERRVPRGTRILLTADHGMVDTDASRQVVLTEHPGLARDVVAVAGEPRFTHLHVGDADEDVAQEVAARFRQELGERAAWVGTRREAAACLGSLSERARGVVGDVVVAMAGTWVLVDPRVHSETAMAMRGVHGSLTEAETLVPLLVTMT